ncbi:MAG: hypothetical protein ACK4S4_00325 [Pyrinomonadaceae bacterium]
MKLVMVVVALALLMSLNAGTSAAKRSEAKRKPPLARRHHDV